MKVYVFRDKYECDGVIYEHYALIDKDGNEVYALDAPASLINSLIASDYKKIIQILRS